MKTKLIMRLVSKIAFIAFLALYAGNAYAIDKTNRVVSPYWQTDTGSYTFVAVSHPSLSGMASSIGVTVNAITNDTTTYANAVSFTVTSGTTTRVFVVRTNHTTINPTSITNSQFFAGTSGFEHGHLQFDPVASNPEVRRSTTLDGDGYLDVTMLSYWGAVVIEQNTTGFAMEFIGDVADSVTTIGYEAMQGASGTDVGGG